MIATAHATPEASTSPDRAHPGITDIIFDFCGVLVDRRVTETLAGRYGAREIAEFFAYDDRSGFHYYDDLLDRGVSFEDACARYASERGSRLAQMFRCYCDHIDAAFTHEVPGMEELLGELRAAGVRLWGLTNGSEAAFACIRARFPRLVEMLSGVVVSGREGVAKPDARLYRIAAERFGVNPARTLFVDDNAINVTAAEAVGLKGLAFVDAAHLRRDLAGLGMPLAAEATDGAHIADAALLVHDGASECETAEAAAGATKLTPLNASADGTREDGAWRAVPLGALALPGAPDPQSGVYRDAFWRSRASEYRALQWQHMDWASVREALARAARELAGRPAAHPEFELAFPTIRERTFLEMWFGYGDPCIEARPIAEGRFEVGYGQHRICPVANFALPTEDAELLGLADGCFSPDGPLAPDTLLPVLVREG